jgi:TonB-dependent starch-binding outer membrane protein SusC
MAGMSGGYYGRSIGSCVLAVTMLAGCSRSNARPADRPAGDSDEISLGYTTESRSRSTSSVSTISGRDLSTIQATHIEELLNLVPGVDVWYSGGRMNVRVRGTRSLIGPNEPLFVVDGVPMSNSATEAIPPSQVFRIDVLKDASATAMYGSRGANGVIVITTKRVR